MNSTCLKRGSTRTSPQPPGPPHPLCPAETPQPLRPPWEDGRRQPLRPGAPASRGWPSSAPSRPGPADYSRCPQAVPGNPKEQKPEHRSPEAARVTHQLVPLASARVPAPHLAGPDSQLRLRVRTSPARPEAWVGGRARACAVTSRNGAWRGRLAPRTRTPPTRALPAGGWVPRQALGRLVLGGAGFSRCFRWRQWKVLEVLTRFPSGQTHTKGPALLHSISLYVFKALSAPSNREIRTLTWSFIVKIALEKTFKILRSTSSVVCSPFPNLTWLTWDQHLHLSRWGLLWRGRDPPEPKTHALSPRWNKTSCESGK